MARVLRRLWRRRACFLVPSNVTLFFTLLLTGSGSLSAFRVYKSLRSVRDDFECIFYSFFPSFLVQWLKNHNETSPHTLEACIWPLHSRA